MQIVVWLYIPVLDHVEIYVTETEKNAAVI